ncbi:MAG: epoxyqueuosine reductase QueH [Coriobacteriales bacterium]|jgi:predicted adenine nucleotide alpha hydrolase (AANH) superfamily ATPase|nr:epoxyqueuosine reductase QueH [Coriobacteriales bacterium]
MEKMLLHCCCAPCANQPIDLLMGMGYQLVLFYANSNIHPFAEYVKRRDCMQDYAKRLDLTWHEDSYQPGTWYQAIGNDGGVFPLIKDEPDIELLNRRRQRCRLCYRYRLTNLAAEAARQDIGLIATTLAISPYQHHDILAEELDMAAQAVGVKAIYFDWRPYYRKGQDKARDLLFYRQKYCGCEFSRQEAIAERAAGIRGRRSAGQVVEQVVERSAEQVAEQSTEQVAGRFGEQQPEQRS